MAKDTKPIDDSDTLKPPVVTRTAAVGQTEVPAGLPPESYMTAQIHVAEGGEYAPPPETEEEAAARLKATPPKPAPEDDDEDDEDGDETASKGKGKKGKK
jgi:hypothetical protein